MRIGVGISTARDAWEAAVVAAAHARSHLAGEPPSLAVLLGSRSHTGKAVDILNAVQEAVGPPALIGCIAQAVVAGSREIEDEAAVAVWLASGLAAETPDRGPQRVARIHRVDGAVRRRHAVSPRALRAPARVPRLSHRLAP